MANLTNGSKSSTLSEDISIGNVDDSININSNATLKQDLTEEELEKQKLMNEYREELTKIQEDIATLRLVLNDKLKRENELKQLLGISFVEEMRNDLAEGLNQIKSTNAFQKAAQTITDLGTTVSHMDAYQKTATGLKTATQKITPAIQTLGGTMKNSLGSLRNTSVFKSFEAGLGSTFSGTRMKNSKSEYNVEDDGAAANGAGGGSIPTSKTTNGLSKQHETIKEEGGKN